MVKGFLLSLFVLFSTTAFAVRPPSSYIDHDTFLSLSKTQQNKIVLSFMEYMVVADDLYKKERAATTSNPPKLEFLKRVVEHLKKIQSLIISEANAAPPTVDKILEARDNNCVFAGWISQTNANDLCVNPRGSGSTPQNKKPLLSNYPKDAYCNDYKNSAGQLVQRIKCNPVVFGLDKENKKPICVLNNKTDNSSLHCMNESIKIGNVDKIREAYKKNPESYNQMATIIHQSCLCEASQHMSAGYFKRIQQKRTCYALLNQYRLIKDDNECTITLATPLNTDFFNDLNTGLIQVKIDPKITDDKVSELESLDGDYKKLLETKDQKTIDFCAADQVKETAAPVCAVTCDKADAAGARKCNIAITGGKVEKTEDANHIFAKGEGDWSVNVFPTGKTAKADLVKVTCAPPVDAVEVVAPTCEVGACEKDDQGLRKCAFKLTGGALAKDKTLTSLPGDKADDIKVEIDPEVNGVKEVICKVEEEAKKSSCKIEIKKQEDKDSKKLDVVLTLTMLKGDKAKDPVAGGDPFTVTTDTKPDESQDQTIVYKGTVDLKEKVNLIAKGFSTKFPQESCEATYPTEAGLGLVVTSKKDDSDPKVINIYIVNVSITPNEKEESLQSKVEWKVEGGGTLKKDPAKPLEVKIEQNDKVQKVCASLEGVKPTDEHCKTIDALEPPKYTLDLSGKNSNNKDFKVTAKVSDGTTTMDKLDNGLTLVWFEKDKAEPTQAEKDKKKKDDEETKAVDDKKKAAKKPSGAAGDTNTGETKAKPKDEEKKPADVKGQVSSGVDLNYSAPINTAKYQICADLMKDGKKEDSKCLPVPAYIAPTAPAPGMPPTPGAYRYRRW